MADPLSRVRGNAYRYLQAIALIKLSNQDRPNDEIERPIDPHRWLTPDEITKALASYLRSIRSFS